MEVGPRHRYRRVGRGGIDPVVRRQLAAEPLLVPGAAENPLARPLARGGAEPRGEIGLARRAQQIGLVERHRAAQKMRMAIGERGHRKCAAEIDHSRFGGSQVAHLTGADRRDTASNDADRIGVRRVRHAGPERSVD